MFYKLPIFLKKIVSLIARIFMSARLAESLKCLKDYSREDIDDILRKKLRFEQDFAERWQAEGLDAMIWP